MAKYQSKKCPHCGVDYKGINYTGVQAKESQIKYGSPLKVCTVCKKEFLDEDYIEIAIEGIRDVDMESVSDKDLFYGFIGLVIGIGAVYYKMYAGFIATLLGIFIPVSELFSYKKRQKKLEVEKKASEERLENSNYAITLKRLGYNVPEKYLPSNKEGFEEEKRREKTRSRMEEIIEKLKIIDKRSYDIVKTNVEKNEIEKEKRLISIEDFVCFFTIRFMKEYAELIDNFAVGMDTRDGTALMTSLEAENGYYTAVKITYNVLKQLYESEKGKEKNEYEHLTPKNWHKYIVYGVGEWIDLGSEVHGMGAYHEENMQRVRVKEDGYYFQNTSTAPMCGHFDRSVELPIGFFAHKTRKEIYDYIQSIGVVPGKTIPDTVLVRLIQTDKYRVNNEKAIDVLRQKIIRKLCNTKNRLASYELISLYGQDAADCFPSGGWARAHFSLDLNTLQISAYVATYPNQFGACIERILSVSSSEFHSIAERLDFPEELKVFKTDEDWKKLFNAELNAAVERFETNVKNQIEERKKEKQKEKKTVWHTDVSKNPIKIENKFKHRKPRMDYTKISIELRQKYGFRAVLIEQKDGEYQIGEGYCFEKRNLSLIEDTWLEQEIDDVLQDKNEEKWQSLPGGDFMDVVVEKAEGICININRETPQRKFLTLLHTLERLAKHGSVIEEITGGGKSKEKNK